jgi:cardiolipin synthase
MGSTRHTPRAGHALTLLEGSAEFFPALVAAVDAARLEVWLETYIFDFTGASEAVVLALAAAARRGVQVRVVVDGFGTSDPPQERLRGLIEAGVEWQVYAPLGSLGLAWPGNWRRLHRKLCVVDREVAFCGGINILDDLHDPNHGPLPAPRLDFCVQARGPLVAEIHRAMQQVWLRLRGVHGFQPQALAQAWLPVRTTTPSTAGAVGGAPASVAPAKAALLLRDNLRHRSRIERAYLRAIGRARDEILIANAYFVPGRRLRLALERAAQRGVRVSLLLQGRYEYFMQYYGSRPVYASLLRAGVQIHEYAPSFLHAKVAVIDGRWSTVGSSNLDPLSLLLAREANLVIDDAGFGDALRHRLLDAIRLQGEVTDPVGYAQRPWRQRVLERLAWVVMRIALLVQGKRYL